jgi:WD40 repeat protein
VKQPAPPDAATTEENPYVGLTHFTEESAERFFGRDTEIALIIGNLRAARLTLLYAESGVGKSSVLRAGVVARLHGNAVRDLRARGRPRLLPVVFSSWSEAPVAGLIGAIGDAVRPYLPEDAALDLPGDDLERAIEIASAAADATLLVVLDQFEEYFLYPEDRAEPKRVAAQVSRCVNRPDLRANFLISIREDSYARLGDLFRGKIRNVYANFLHLEFLDHAGARESIEKPIEGAFAIEPALVDAVLDQVRRAPVASSENGAQAKAHNEVETTYLQLVMRRLWEVEAEAGSHQLRLRTLEGLGGAEAIISGHLDRAMEGGADGAGGLTDDQRRVAASIFQFLVTSGGTKIALTAKDLSDMSGLAVAEIDPVLRHLSSPELHILRPVSSADGHGETRFEIFHDALARPIVDWRTRVEEEELDARVARERAEKEEAQRAAAEAERREAQERKRKRLALGLLGVAVVALLGGAAYFAYDQSKLADQREAAAQSIQAAQRISELSSEPAFGPAARALASVEAYRLSPTAAARNQALAELQTEPAMPRTLVGDTEELFSVAYWPGSDNFVSGGEEGTVRLWDARGDELRSLPADSKGGVISVEVSKPLDGARNGPRVVAAGTGSGVVRLWKIDGSGRRVLRREKLRVSKADSVSALAFDPRRPNVLAVGDVSAIALWDLSDLRHPRQLGPSLAEPFVSDLAFDPSGRRLMAATFAGKAWKVSASGLSKAAPLPVTAPSPYSVAVAPNGSFAFGGEGGIYLWDAPRKRELHISQPEPVLSLKFADGGSVLVSGAYDQNITTWDVTSGRPFGPPRAVDAYQVSDVAVSPDSKTIVSADADGFLKLWPMNPRGALATTVGGLSPRELGPRVPQISSLAVGASGEVAAAGGAAGTTIWKLGGGTGAGHAPRPLVRIPGRNRAVVYHGDVLVAGSGDSFAIEDTGPGCDSMPEKPCRLAAPTDPHSSAPVSGLALSEYEHRLLLVSSGHRGGEDVLNLWDITDAREGKVAFVDSRRVDSEIHQVAFSSSSPLIVAGAQDGSLRTWDVSDLDHPGQLEKKTMRGNGHQPVLAVAFSRDGTLLASGGRGQQVLFWRIDSEGPALSLISTRGSLAQVGTRTVLSLAFSPDGETLAVGDNLGEACIYEVESRYPIGGSSCLQGHLTEALRSAGITSMQFAQNADGGTSLLTAGTLQPILSWDSLLWSLSDDDDVEREIERDVCALAGRNLDALEWSAIFSSTSLAGDRDETCKQYPLP